MFESHSRTIPQNLFVGPKKGGLSKIPALWAGAAKRFMSRCTRTQINRSIATISAVYKFVFELSLIEETPIVSILRIGLAFFDLERVKNEIKRKHKIKIKNGILDLFINVKNWGHHL